MSQSQNTGEIAQETMASWWIYHNLIQKGTKSRDEMQAVSQIAYFLKYTWCRTLILWCTNFNMSNVFQNRCYFVLTGNEIIFKVPFLLSFGFRTPLHAFLYFCHWLLTSCPPLEFFTSPESHDCKQSIVLICSNMYPSFQICGPISPHRGKPIDNSKYRLYNMRSSYYGLASHTPTLQ